MVKKMAVRKTRREMLVEQDKQSSSENLPTGTRPEVSSNFLKPSVAPYAEAALITAILFPLVRPLYMGAAASVRLGVRR